MELRNIIDAIGDCRRILIIGDSDTGKTFLAGSLLEYYRLAGERVVHVDLDMGQSSIGPPTTIGLTAPGGATYLYFVGNVTPFGVFKEIEQGIMLFERLMISLAHDRVVIDTPGLVKDGFAWSLAKAEARRMGVEFAILLDRKGETSRIADGFRSLGLPFHTGRPASAVQKKNYVKRANHRLKLFVDYFKGASELRVPLQGKRIIRLGKEEGEGLLIGLCDDYGFLVALAILIEEQDEAIIVTACATELEGVTTIKYGRYPFG